MRKVASFRPLLLYFSSIIMKPRVSNVVTFASPLILFSKFAFPETELNLPSINQTKPIKSLPSKGHSSNLVQPENIKDPTLLLGSSIFPKLFVAVFQNSRNMLLLEIILCHPKVWPKNSFATGHTSRKDHTL